MPIFIENEEQRSPGWFKTKAGIPSASRFADIITTQGKQSTARMKYLYTLTGEKLLGTKEEEYQSTAMLRGVELEESAREYYSFITGNEVKQVGFCFPDKKKRYGCSSDGLVGKDGMVEIKCRNLSNHIASLLSKKLKSPDYQQVQGQLLVTSRKWIDYLCYYPGLPHLLIRVFPDKEFQKKLKNELIIFCDELNDITNKLKEK